VTEPAAPNAAPPANRRTPGSTWQRRVAESDVVPTLVVTFASIVLALLVGAVLIIVSNPDVLSHFSYFFADPLGAIKAALDAVGQSYWAMLTGAFGSGNAISQTLTRATPLICGGLSVSLAFRVGLFNIGAQGQLIMGAICSAYVGFAWQLPVFIHLVVALIAGLIGGAVWGGVVGLLKARTGAHEVIVTIMLNYIALSILRWLLSTERFQVAGTNNPKSPVVDPNARFPQIFTVHIGFLLALAAAFGVWWLLSRTTVGFQMRAVGANAHAARTAGMSVAAAYTLAMVLAGGLAGLAGVQQVQGHQDPLTDGIAGTVGFDSITVALLGRATPLGTVLAGLLFGALASGGLRMQAATNTPLTLTTVLQALIVLFVAAPALVRSVFHIPETREPATVPAAGWNA
jgi:general nucleoside transport system permease protein